MFLSGPQALLHEERFLLFNYVLVGLMCFFGLGWRRYARRLRSV